MYQVISYMMLKSVEKYKTVTPKSGSDHKVVIYMEFQLQVFHWEGFGVLD